MSYCLLFGHDWTPLAQTNIAGLVMCNTCGKIVEAEKVEGPIGMNGGHVIASGSTPDAAR